MKNIALLILIAIYSIGCKKETKELSPSTTIEFKKTGSKLLTDKVEDLFFSKASFIKLKSKNNETSFGKINQIKIVKDKIYILDEGIKSLLVYGIDGYAISKVGSYGQGPHEYLDIASFDVDKSGYIYTIDGRLDKLFIYDDKFNYVSSSKLPFEVDQIQLLENGYYMFALSSWNKGKCEGRKIAITDKKLNIIKSYLSYDEYTDDNYWISNYQFIKTDEYIIYNRPIDDNIYLFSLDGSFLKSIKLDFEKQNIPNNVKKNIEQNIKEFDNYYILKNLTIVTSKFMLGTLWNNRQSKLFIFDNQTSTIYQSNKIEDSDNTLCTGFCDSTIISFIDPDYYNEHIEFNNLPKDIIEHLKNGEFVLCIRSIK